MAKAKGQGQTWRMGNIRLEAGVPHWSDPVPAGKLTMTVFSASTGKKEVTADLTSRDAIRLAEDLIGAALFLEGDLRRRI